MGGGVGGAGRLAGVDGVGGPGGPGGAVPGREDTWEPGSAVLSSPLFFTCSSIQNTFAILRDQVCFKNNMVMD